MRKNVLPMTAGVFGSLALAAMGSLFVAGTASADLIDVTIEDGPFQHPDGDLWDTFRVVAHFDDLGDRIGAVAGVSAQALLFFTGGGDMYNQLAFEGFPFNDFPSVGFGGETYDSYVTIGATEFPHNTQFSPNFLGEGGKIPPQIQVILGDSFGPENNGAWFFFGGPTLVTGPDGSWNGDVVIAQFTVPEGVGFHLEGNVGWVDAPPPGLGGGDLIIAPFEVDNIPAPGAMALLGLAGLAGARRRRRRS